MTLEIGLLLGLVSVMVVLFMTEALPVDLTGLLGLSAMIAFGYVDPSDAFSGFSSPAVITMLCSFILGAALTRAGVGDWIGERVYRVAGRREKALVGGIMLMCGLLSAFMNNVAATAVLMPAVMSIASRSGVPASRLLMPLAFASILGGTTTLVGTPPNLLAAQVLEQRGLPSFALFDFAPIGVPILLLGILLTVVAGLPLLPKNGGGTHADRRDLTRVYRLQEHLFSVRIPPGSPLDGLTLREAALGASLGLRVVQIVRGGRRRIAPGLETRLQAGDALIVAGRRSDLVERLRLRGIAVGDELPPEAGDVTGLYDLALVRLRPESPLAERTVRDARFRERFGAVPAGVFRGGRSLRDQGPEVRLSAGDEILFVGVPAAIDRVLDHPDFEVVASGDGSPAVERLRRSLFLVFVPPDSALARDATTVASFERAARATVAAIVRDHETVWAASPDGTIQAGDRLLIAGAPARVLALAQIGELAPAPLPSPPDLETEELAVVEAVIGPRSRLKGKTVVESRFRNRYGADVVAIWREGEPLRTDIAEVPLRFGDALLLQAPRSALSRLRSDPDLVLLLESDAAPARATAKAGIAVTALLAMIALVAARVFPIEVAAFMACVLVLVGRVLSMDDAVRAIDWKTVLLVASTLPVGMAMERSGAAPYVTGTVMGGLEGHGPLFALIVLSVLASLLSQCLDAAPAVILLSPVVLSISGELAVSPRPLMMAVGLGASVAFLTPFSHKANLLVMSAGGYRPRDFARVGALLSVGMWVAIALGVPLLFPFHPAT